MPLFVSANNFNLTTKPEFGLLQYYTSKTSYHNLTLILDLLYHFDHFDHFGLALSYPFSPLT